MSVAKRILQLSLVTLAVIAFAAVAEAQQRPGGGGRGPGGGGPGRGPGGFGMDGSRLLSVDKVKAELKITEEQTKKLADLAEKRRGGMEGLRDMTDEQRQAAMTKMAEQSKKDMASVLSEGQLTRLNQITLQMAGFQGLGRKDVVEKLGLSAEQGEKLTAVRDEMQAKMEKLRPDRPADGAQDVPGEQRMAEMQKRMGQMREIQQEALTKAVDTILTPAQKEKWTVMLGPKSDITMADIMQGRGPGGNRPARNAQGQ